MIAFPKNLSWICENDSILLNFELEKGSYASMLCRELILADFLVIKSHKILCTTLVLKLVDFVLGLKRQDTRISLFCRMWYTLVSEG